MLLACLPSFSLASSSFLFLWPKSNPAFAGFQCRQKTSSSLGILQDSSTILGLQRHPPLGTKQLLDSQPFSCETAIVGLPEPQSVSYSNKSHVCVINYMHMYTHICYIMFLWEPWLIQMFCLNIRNVPCPWKSHNRHLP